MSAPAADLPSKTAEWRAHWPLVMAAFIGISFPIMPYNALGLFMQPLSHEFGWSRTAIAAGGSMGAAVSIPLAPFVGALVDRWGARRLALPGLLLTGFAIASFGLANGEVAQWLALWGGYALVALMLKSTVWTAAVSGTFTAGRSLALAVTLCGSALAATCAPPVARWLIDAYGWRHAWFYLALGWGVPALALCVLFLFDAHDRKKSAVTSEPVELPGLTVRQAVRCLPLWRIGLATLLALLFSSALIVHQVPLLTEMGVSRKTAALLASLAGLAGVAGNLTTGWLMQKFDAGWVVGITNTAMATALFLLLTPFRSPALIVGAMAVVGYAGGTKLQICAYLTSLYAGLRNYGKIFGVMASIIAATGAVGPLFGGIMYDLARSYTLLIVAGIPTSLIAAALLVKLGPFPDWSARASPAPA